jgi:phosphoglycerate dehydrogenase-like enzyme
VHLSPETTGLVTQALIDSMKPGAFLINTSRGAIVDESALLAALQSGRLGGAGLDVLEGEPETANHPLVRYAQTHDNLLITPHVGGFSPDAVRVVCAHAAGKNPRGSRGRASDRHRQACRRHHRAWRDAAVRRAGQRRDVVADRRA